jgi:DNA-binding NarL/FixJ family response regulator
MAPIRVLLVDDNPEFLHAARRFIQTQALFEWIGDATRGADALRQVEQLAPDLVLLDWMMPEMTGAQVTQQIKARPRAPRVIICSLHDEPPYHLAARAFGADGLIAKDHWSAQLLARVRELFSTPTIEHARGTCSTPNPIG